MKHAYCQHEAVWNGYPIMPINVDDLWQSVPIAITFKGKDFYSKVKEDIEQNGLHFPLIVVKCTYKELQDVKRKYKGLTNLPHINASDEYYAVWGGSNRLHIVKQLGYTSVDCILIDHDFRRAFNLQRDQRAPYLGHFYK